MTTKDKQARDEKIREYRKDHTLMETGKKFNLDPRTIFRICNKHDN